MVSNSSQAFEEFNVKLKILGEAFNCLEEYEDPVVFKLHFNAPCKCYQADFYDGDKKILSVTLTNNDQIYRSSDNYILIKIPRGSALVELLGDNGNQRLQEIQFILSAKALKQSVFNLRTEDTSAKQYFHYYGCLAQQQNMLQDYPRTSTYQAAMLQNTADFKDKVVLDVGAGSGILSFFAVQAGAKKVYAIEASNMAVHCQNLIQSNRLDDKITLIAGKVEEVDVPEKVDMIISEPMGYMLFNERMLESYLHAKKWLKPEGNMFPTTATLFCAPFTDEKLYMEQFNKAAFWCQENFHSVDLSSLKESAMDEFFKQPIKDTFDAHILLAKPYDHKVDFLHSSEDSLHNLSINLSFKILNSASLHGLAFWFDVAFVGSQQTMYLSTAPDQPLTHWYQIRCLLQKPLVVESGQEITGSIAMKANERQSYNVDITLDLVGTAASIKYSYDLKSPYLRYLHTSTISHDAPGVLGGIP